jgi:hypothetical protein
VGDITSIAAASKRVADMNPSSIYAYVDAITLRFRQPPRVPAWLQAALKPVFDPISRRVKQRAHLANEPLIYKPLYPYRLELRQPRAEELRWLAQHDILITKLECALDWVFNSWHKAANAKDVIDAYWIKKWHRGHLKPKGSSRYWARKSAANIPVRYDDRPCRITGEEDCLHIEWRLCGAKAVKRVFASVQELIDADWRTFWEQRLLLYAIDVNELGRLHNNSNGSRRRKPLVQLSNGYDCDWDARVGYILARTAKPKQSKHRMRYRHEREDADAIGMTTQRVINAYGRMFRRKSWLVRLDVEHLLPGGEWTECNSGKIARRQGVMTNKCDLPIDTIEQTGTPPGTPTPTRAPTCTASKRPEHYDRKHQPKHRTPEHERRQIPNTSDGVPSRFGPVDPLKK